MEGPCHWGVWQVQLRAPKKLPSGPRKALRLGTGRGNECLSLEVAWDGVALGKGPEWDENKAGIFGCKMEILRFHSDASLVRPAI